MRGPYGGGLLGGWPNNQISQWSNDEGGQEQGGRHSPHHFVVLDEWGGGTVGPWVPFCGYPRKWAIAALRHRMSAGNLAASRRSTGHCVPGSNYY